METYTSKYRAQFKFRFLAPSVVPSLMIVAYGVGCVFRRMEHHADDMLHHMLSVVGAAPCGEARYHLADALSHVDKEIRRLAFRDSSNRFSQTQVRFFIAYVKFRRDICLGMNNGSH